MSFLKYMTDQGERRQPRTADGYPMRGDRVPFLKQDEYDNIELGLDVHVKVFATDKPDDLAEYQRVLDKIANGLYVRQGAEREEFLPDRGAWLILCRWAEVKGEISPNMFDAVGGYVR